MLLKLLLAELADRNSQEQLQAILAGVSTRLAEHYGGQSAGQALQERLAQLAQMSDERGTPITIVEKGNTVVLREYSCPYFNVAQDTPNVCELEQQMLAQVLGRPVRLAKRIVDGHAGCEFVIDDVVVNPLSSTPNEPL